MGEPWRGLSVSEVVEYRHGNQQPNRRTLRHPTSEKAWVLAETFLAIQPPIGAIESGAFPATTSAIREAIITAWATDRGDPIGAYLLNELDFARSSLRVVSCDYVAELQANGAKQ